MKEISIRLLTLLSVGFFIVSCNEDNVYEHGINQTEIPTSGKIINKNGASDGLSYSLKNVSLNSDLLILNSDNIDLTSTEYELRSGIIKFKLKSEDISSEITENKIVFISVNNNTFLRKIDLVNTNSDGSFELHTVQAHLGEAFEGGEIDFTVDLYEASKIQSLNSVKGKSLNYENEYFYDIINLNGKYNQWDFEYDPATNISMSLNIKMNFAKKQLLPSQFSTIFELNTDINPYFTFSGSYHKTHTDDLIKFIPQSIIDQIKNQEFEIDIPVNTFGIESLPAKIKIKDINIPTTFEANLSQESKITYGINGNFKIGYIANIDGLKVSKTTVYENNLQVNLPSESGFHGELLSSTAIVLTPDISILNDSYNVNGDLKLTLETETNSYIVYPENKKVFGSKGTFKATSDLQLDLLLTKVPIQILNQKKELWNVGTIDKTITYSNLTWNVTSSNTTNIFNNTRSYRTNFSLDYKYPIVGKMLPDELFISYEVYQKNGTTRLVSVNNTSLKPQNLTTTNFTFSLEIPYRKTGGIFSTTYETESIIKSIVIKDNKGYIYQGILNPTTNVVENSFLIKR